NNGFGLQANYTYSNGGTDDGLEVPFNSRHTVNFTPYYENDLFSARLTYSWRDTYFRAIGLDGVATTNAPYAQLDASLGFKISKNIEFSLEGLNLLDETQYRYAGSDDRPLSFTRNGRRYFAHWRFRF
ncbi:MAG: TonB-dependent receptor domain-containing protein, partial [Luteimonas sp.]